MSRKGKRRIIGLLAIGATVAAVVPTFAGAASTPSLGYDPSTDGGSLSFIGRVVGAQQLWDKGFTGLGVDVAVIDTGVSRVPGLDQPGKVIDGPDLSFDSQNDAFAHIDGFGHGTLMASIIAGSDKPGTKKNCSNCLGMSPYSDTTKFEGIAPGARIINVKAGAFDGSSDVSQIIAAIDWVVQHRRDNGMNIRVLNLSYGTDSVQAASIDPLSYAAEVAWRNGIVVVASAGNDGLAVPSLANPAFNSTILAVGASDNRNTIDLKDDRIPTFAQHGTATRRVDVVAPGVHVLGLRVPGSFIDTNVTTGKVGTRFQRGSGTSEAAAVVSGVAALLVQRYPNATPDQIKDLIVRSAVPTVETTTENAKMQAFADNMIKWWQGNGVVQAHLATGQLTPQAAWAMTSTGTGSLEAARGSSHVVSEGIALTGEQDIRSMPWDGLRWSAAAFNNASWTGGTWNGLRWSGDGWDGLRWSTSDWAGEDWAGLRWSGLRWSSMGWDGLRWSGDGWNGLRWSGSAWDGLRWSNSGWD